MTKFSQRNAKPLTALALIAIVFIAAQLPHISDTERQRLGRAFRFSTYTLPVVSGHERRTVRPVHPSLQKISAWISSVGAAVALADLDGDQFPNDVCYVDTCTDQVIVLPVPGTDERYVPFSLDPGPRLFDRNTMAPMGCVPGDFNEDGLTDIVVYYWGRTPVVFLRVARQGSGIGVLQSASFAAHEIVPGGERWYTNALTQADVDGDGHTDLIIGNYFQDGSRILDALAGGEESMPHSMSRAFNGGRSRFLLWAGSTSGEQPTVQFRDVSDALNVDGEPIAAAWTLAIGAADLDGDQLPEIYFANDFGPDRLLHNRSRPGLPHFGLLNGQRTLTTPASKVLGNDSFKGMGVDFGDLNEDGFLDVVVSNIAADYALEESHFAYLSTGDIRSMTRGIATYIDSSESLGLSRSGWGWDVRLADFNNDTILEVIQATGFIRGDYDCWPELHEIAMGNDQLLSTPTCWHCFQPGQGISGLDHNFFFVRAGDGRYYDMAHEIGIGEPRISRGIGIADVDGDGDLDLAVANQWEESLFLRNDCPSPGSYIGLRLRLPVGEALPPRTLILDGHSHPSHISSRPAFGAAATIHLPDGRKLVGQVDGGNGHSGVRSPDLHFGLGDAPKGTQLRVELRWRDSRGTAHFETYQLTAGWHTILLSSQDTK